MPAERTSRAALRQTTLQFSKPAAGTSKPHVQAAEHAHTEPPVEQEETSSSSQSPLKPSKSQPGPATKPKARARARAKAKASDENRMLTDVILCIKPEFTDLIARRKKNHEYRKYLLKDTVKHLWLYETAPTSAITYVMSTTKPKVPGEVNDPSGVGNDDFDKGLKVSKYGYPVTELYKLKKPLSTTELKARFDMAVPQGWRYAPRQLVEQCKLEDMERIF